MQHYDLLEEILKKKKQGNFKWLKEKLGIENDEEVMKLLVSYLEFFIEKFSFNTVYDKNKNIKKILGYLSYHHSTLLISDEEYKNIDQNLVKISDKIDYVLENPGFLYNQNHVVKNRLLLETLRDDIREIHRKFDKQGLSNNTKHLEMYRFILTLLDCTNSYRFLCELVKKHSSMVNLKVNDKYLIEVVIDKFIDCFTNNSSYQDKLFYERVIKLFVMCPSFQVDRHFLQRKFALALKRLKKYDSKSLFEKQGENFLIYEISCLFDNYTKNEEKTHDMYPDLKVKYQLDRDFTDQELAELELLIKPNSDEYQDHRMVPVLTIDAPGTYRFEDSLYLKEMEDGYLFRLYSSDAEAFIFDHFFLERRAYHHALNYFLPDKVIEDYLSFKKGQDIYAVCYEFLLDKNYDVKKIDVYKAIVNTHNNFHYADVKKSIKKRDPKIIDLYVFAKNLSLKRMHKKLKTKDQIIEDLSFCGNYNIGPLMVGELSSFTNDTLANSFDLPFIYRSHSFEEDMIENNIEDSFSDEGRKNEIMHILKKAKVAGAYYSTALDKKYADFCSPIRKSDALWNQKVLVNRDNPKKIADYRTRLAEVCWTINDKYLRNRDYEDEVKTSKRKVLKKVDKKTRK